MKKTIAAAVVAVSVALSVTQVSTVFAAGVNVPYESYNYDYRKNIVITPPPYIPDGSISGATLGIDAFNNAKDLTVAEDGLIYVADTGNNRIVVLSADMRSVVDILTSFDNNGSADSFKAPSSVAVSESNRLYIADSENNRIIVLDSDRRTLLKIVENPKSEVLPAGFVFVPLRITVDYADRIFVIAQNMFQGIMVFEPDGHFSGFFGTINVQITLWQRFWRALATKAERDNSRLFVPTEFTGIDVDPSGFVYASNMDPEGKKAVRRLNPKGEDVALQGDNGNTGGDVIFNTLGSYGGVSRIVDVVYHGSGIYSLLDSQRGRVFTYDREGNLLYIFGGLGSQVGSFRTPSAIEKSGDRILVLDMVRNEIVLFKETTYGALINEAVALRFDGDEVSAVEKWKEVLLLNENFELANVGIGKAYLTAGENKLAMHYLKLGMNRTYYSIAFKRYRNEILKNNLGGIMTGVVVAVVCAFAAIRVRRRVTANALEGGE